MPGVTIVQARKLALSFPETTEHDHFGRPAFRARTIFATLWPEEKRMMVKLTRPLQLRYCSENLGVFFPVPNKWGEGGATFVDLTKVGRATLTSALFAAWKEAPPTSAPRARAGARSSPRAKSSPKRRAPAAPTRSARSPRGARGSSSARPKRTK